MVLGKSFDHDLSENDFTFGFLLISQQISNQGRHPRLSVSIICILSPPGKFQMPLGQISIIFKNE